MKTASVSLTLGVCVLLLSALTVSAVSLDVSPNHQQFFSGPSKVFLSCVDDGQTVDGWTVKRTKEGRSTEDCEAAADFERVNRSFCLLIPDSSFRAVLWCENSGQRTDNVSISVSDTGLILDIPALPVMTGSDVTLHCRQKNGDAVTANFSINGRHVGPQSELNISKVQTSHEGLYACSTDEAGKSPESRLRVRAPPPPPSTPSSPPPLSTTPSSPPSTTPSSPPTDSSLPPPSSSSFLVPAVSGLVCVVLLVLGLVLVVILCRKLKGGNKSSPPEELTYADVTIRERAKRRDKYSVDQHAVYSDVKTHTAGPAEVTYGQVVFKNQRKTGRRKEQPADPDIVYSSARAGR